MFNFSKSDLAGQKNATWTKRGFQNVFSRFDELFSELRWKRMDFLWNFKFIRDVDTSMVLSMYRQYCDK